MKGETAPACDNEPLTQRQTSYLHRSPPSHFRLTGVGFLFCLWKAIPLIPSGSRINPSFSYKPTTFGSAYCKEEHITSELSQHWNLENEWFIAVGANRWAQTHSGLICRAPTFVLHSCFFVHW